jgi:hypothetical protein
MILVSRMGMLVYMFAISSEANLLFELRVISFKLLVRWEVFLMVKTKGKGENSWSFLLNNFANLYAGAFLQFTIGLIGWLTLWIFISPLVVGGCVVKVYILPFL